MPDKRIEARTASEREAWDDGFASAAQNPLRADRRITRPVEAALRDEFAGWVAYAPNADLFDWDVALANVMGAVHEVLLSDEAVLRFLRHLDEPGDLPIHPGRLAHAREALTVTVDALTGEQS